MTFASIPTRAKAPPLPGSAPSGGRLLAYPPGAFRRDLTVSGLAILAVALLAVIVPLTAWSSIAIGLAAAMAGAHAVATERRRQVRLVLDADGVRLDGETNRKLSWAALARMQLRFYSVAPGRERGWFELRLTGDGTSISVDDRLEAFHDLLRVATLAASRNGLALDRATCANLVWLGLGEIDETTGGGRR